jgi:protease-4
MNEEAKPSWRDVSFRRIWKVLGWIVLVLTIIFFWCHYYLEDTSDLYSSSTEESSSDEYSYAGCNVAGIALHGDLYTYTVSDPETGDSGDTVGSEDVVYQIEMANEAPEVKAILLEVDSYGGYPVAAEEIAIALKKATKPTVVQIREAGLSAGYWAATGADTIFASELSDVGSISVTQSYIDESKLNEMEGYTYNSLSTGKYKDMLDPQKPLTAEERALLERDLQIIHEAFVKTVAENRGMDINKVRAMADGSSMLGKMALENGLIDKLGGIDEVESYLEEIVGAEPVICW